MLFGIIAALSANILLGYKEDSLLFNYPGHTLFRLLGLVCF